MLLKLYRVKLSVRLGVWNVIIHFEQKVIWVTLP